MVRRVIFISIMFVSIVFFNVKFVEFGVVNGPISIEDKYQEPFVKVREYIAQHEIYSKENMWCNRIIEKGNSIIFWFSSGGGYDVYVSLFGFYEMMNQSSGYFAEFEYKNGIVVER